MIIVVNYSRPEEQKQVQDFVDRFDELRVITDGRQQELRDAKIWKVPDMNKKTSEWTKRFLRTFLEVETQNILLKIDPDTRIRELVEMTDAESKTYDVMGDFRKHNLGWTWFGAYQMFTRNAAKAILADPEYNNTFPFQDIPLAWSVKRLKLRCLNSPHVNGWALGGDEEVSVMHKGLTKIERQKSGYLVLND